MYRYILVGMVVAAVACAAPAAMAETASDASLTETQKTELIAKLRARIAELEAQVARVKNATGTPALLRPVGLRKGAEGEEVRRIQEWLKSMPDLYPSGLVTGYFGAMTEEALKRFQTKHGLPATGELDDATKEKMEALITERSGAMQSRRTEGGTTTSSIMPPRAGFNIPLCVTAAGAGEVKIAKSIAEARTLIAAGAKLGRCKGVEDRITLPSPEDDE